MKKLATLNEKRIKKRKKQKLIFFLVVFFVQLIALPLIVSFIDQLLVGIANGNLDFESFQYNYFSTLHSLFENKKLQQLCLLVEVIFFSIALYFSVTAEQTLAKVDTWKVTHNIEIPVPAGAGQHGSERFLTEKEKKELFRQVTLKSKSLPESIERAGLLLEEESDKKGEHYYYLPGDNHSIIIGMTGAGKNRRILFKTIGLQILSGVSIILSDVKGENFYYTSPFARKRNYKIYDFDLRQPEKSIHYNFLQPVIDAYNNKNSAKAIDYTWDIVSSLVGEPKGEPLWSNGESATIAAAILAVVWEAPDEYKNLTNVYYFISNMCKADEYGQMLLNDYLKKLPDWHPAKGVFAMAEIAADKTRSSFFTAALGTLRLFTNPYIAEMTSYSDFNLKDLSKEKSILYMIIPDEKSTLYPIASLLITQAYMMQVEFSNECGGRLPVDTDYDLDEIGNFPKIPVLMGMASAGRSRGIRINLFLQSYQQLKTKYKDDYETIKSNCKIKLYLKTDEPSTLKEISGSLGKYTVEVSSASTSVNDGKRNQSNYSSSASLTGRALLEPSEIEHIEDPDAMVMITGKYAGITNLPDIKNSIWNEVYGLKDEVYNRKLIMERDQERVVRTISEKIPLWGIWNQIKKDEEQQPQSKQERISFL